jgi:zinc/manganese transport system permease protein
MTEAFAFLWPPFLVATCLTGIHTYFGIKVLARKVIFVDLALAQVAALGATTAFMLGHPAQGFATYAYSLAFTLLAAALLAFTRVWATRVPQEALIGVVYVVAAAAAVLLIDRAPQGAEHLKQILTGNILLSGLDELAIIVPLYAAVGAMHWLLRRRLADTGTLAWDFVFYATFGVVVTSSVAIAGVLLVFSFLIIPAAIGVMFVSSPARQLAIGWIAGTVTSAAGLAASFAFDLPTGAAMVCAFGAALTVAGLLYPFLRGDPRSATRMAISTLRWTAAAILTASAVQFATAPRGDQPLMDVAEHVFPSLRALYFSRAEQATYVDAGQYAERYRVEADQLNDREKRSRTDGPLDDLALARMSSFLKSYGEMRKGEQFVMDEVRGRARERVRWGLGAGLMALALLLAPLPWSRIWLHRRAPLPACGEREQRCRTASRSSAPPRPGC